MFARFDENPAMTLRVIKETKRYGRTDARTDGRTGGRTDNMKTVYPLQTKFAGGIKNYRLSRAVNVLNCKYSLESCRVRIPEIESQISFWERSGSVVECLT